MSMNECLVGLGDVVPIKDGYGFVVYEFHQDYEKSLRALRGRSICEERSTVTWSTNNRGLLETIP